jgi:hypothetical protein
MAKRRVKRSQRRNRFLNRLLDSATCQITWTAAIAAMGTVGLQTAFATTSDWNVDADGDWGNMDNWQGLDIPNSTITANIQSGTAIVSSSDTASAYEVQLNGYVAERIKFAVADEYRGLCDFRIKSVAAPEAKSQRVRLPGDKSAPLSESDSHAHQSLPNAR